MAELCYAAGQLYNFIEGVELADRRGGGGNAVTVDAQLLARRLV